jgi:hypothetical protein
MKLKQTSFQFPPVSYKIQNYYKSILLLAIRFHAGILLGLFIDLAGGSHAFLPNVGRLSTDCTVFYPRRLSSQKPLS